MGFVEKIGLPPKPYDKNKDWTPDSPNCEDCEGAFTYFNRKHHCRRCGGLFCNNCTLDRVYLRGQGDAAARVCKPCKQIEEAIKFELRHGKSKTPRGSSNPSNKDDNTEALLRQLLEKPHDEEVNVESIVASVANDDHEFLSPSQEKTPISPTKLHEQAQEEKKRYSALKKQGKDAEALKAFKRAKELERQAEAVEKELKHQRRVSAGSSSIFVSKGSPRKEDPGSPDANISRRKSDPSDTSKKCRAPSQDLGKEKASSTEKDDLLSELKALGWSDKEIREVDKKPKEGIERRQNYELDEETLECPVCNHFLSPPIHQCLNGHIVCAACYEKLQGKECPFCRTTLFAHSRNLAVEKIVDSLRTKCVHAAQGCTEVMKPPEKEEHAKEACEYRPLQCPIPECRHRGPKRGIPEHFKSIHSTVTVQLQPWTRSVKFSMLSDKKWQYVLVMAEKELLLVHAFCSADHFHPLGLEDLQQLQHESDSLELRHTVSVFGCSSFGTKPLKYKLKVTIEYSDAEEGNTTINSTSFESMTVKNQMNENVWQGWNYVLLPNLDSGVELDLKLSLV